jgi:hypothetical protein
MNGGRVTALLLVSTLATAGIGWFARAPYSTPDAANARLRLSWRLRGEKSETCRPRTQAELEALPVHMRTPEVCETRLLPYRLTVRIDEGPPDTATVLPGGVRGDRPVFVLREYILPPGEHRVSVRFTRDEDAAGTNGATNGEAPQEPAESAALAIEAAVTAQAGEIHLITVAPDGRRFVHIAPGGR